MFLSVVVCNGQILPGILDPQTNATPPPSITPINTVCTASAGPSVSTNMTGANGFIAVLSGYDSPSMAISDSLSNSWTPLTNYGTSANVQLAYAQNATAGASMTFTASGGGAQSFCVIGFSGLATSSMYQGKINGSITGYPITTQQPGSISPTGYTLIVLGADTGNAAPSSWTVDSSFTGVQFVGWTESNQGVGIAYLIQASGTAVNPAWAWNTGVQATSTQAAFSGQ